MMVPDVVRREEPGAGRRDPVPGAVSLGEVRPGGVGRRARRGSRGGERPLRPGRDGRHGVRLEVRALPRRRRSFPRRRPRHGLARPRRFLRWVRHHVLSGHPQERVRHAKRAPDPARESAGRERPVDARRPVALLWRRGITDCRERQHRRLSAHPRPGRVPQRPVHAHPPARRRDGRARRSRRDGAALTRLGRGAAEGSGAALQDRISLRGGIPGEAPGSHQGAVRAVLVPLDPDHPGFRDAIYRARRNEIARMALAYRDGDPLPRVSYTPEEEAVRRAVWEKLTPLHERLAAAPWRESAEALSLDRTRVPQLADVSETLQAGSGFRMIPVAGLIHPDIVRLSRLFGEAARRAGEATMKRLELAYWYTVEFGVVEEKGELKAWGCLL